MALERLAKETCPKTQSDTRGEQKGKKAVMKPVINMRRRPAQKDICKAIQACTRGANYYVEDEDAPLEHRSSTQAALAKAG